MAPDGGVNVACGDDVELERLCGACVDAVLKAWVRGFPEEPELSMTVVQMQRDPWARREFSEAVVGLLPEISGSFPWFEEATR